MSLTISPEAVAAAIETIQVESARLRLEDLLELGFALHLSDGFSFNAEGKLALNLTELEQIALAAAMGAVRQAQAAADEDEALWNNEGMEALPC